MRIADTTTHSLGCRCCLCMSGDAFYVFLDCNTEGREP
jgi:hypothetical protein